MSLCKKDSDHEYQLEEAPDIVRLARHTSGYGYRAVRCFLCGQMASATIPLKPDQRVRLREDRNGDNALCGV